MVELNLYELLGVNRSATFDEIKRAYRSLVQKCHPDKNLSEREWATGMMKKLNKALHTLSDPVLRNEYDDNLYSIEKMHQSQRDNAQREADEMRQPQEAEDIAMRAHARAREGRAKQEEAESEERRRQQNAETVSSSRRQEAKRKTENEEVLRRQNIDEERKKRFHDQRSAASITQPSVAARPKRSINQWNWIICILMAVGLVAKCSEQAKQPQIAEVYAPAQVPASAQELRTPTKTIRQVTSPELQQRQQIERQQLAQQVLPKAMPTLPNYPSAMTPPNLEDMSQYRIDPIETPKMREEARQVGQKFDYAIRQCGHPNPIDESSYDRWSSCMAKYDQ
jgi:curved DNA-binding protein CbpA